MNALAAAASLLAEYTPMINSLQALWPNISDYWLWLLPPLIVGISAVYKATRVEDLRHLTWETTKMSLQIMLVLIGASVLLYATHAIVIRIT